MSITKKSKPLLFSRRFVAVGVVVVAVVVGLTAWVQYKPAKAPHYTGPTERMTTGLIGEYAALVWIAHAQGYFTDQGLDVTLKEYPSGPAALDGLLTGKVDMAMASDFAGVRNSFTGADLKILANLSKSEAFDMIARRDHGIKDLADLKGKKIGLTRKTVGEFYLGQFLTFNRLALRDINLVDMPQDQLGAALKAGQVDAVVVFEPNAYKAKKQLGANAVRWSVQSGQSIYSLLYTTGKFTRERPQVIERYLRAVVQAEQFVKNHEAEARTIIAARLKYDAAYINYIWPKFQFAATLDQELLLNMDDEARWTIENKLTSNSKLPNYLNFLYLPGLKAVKPEGITVIH